MHWFRSIGSLAVCAAILGGARAADVSATTGPSGLPPAQYRVAAATAAHFLGQFSLQSVADGARLSRGQMAIDYNDLHYLAGIASFGGYDAGGHQTTWVGSLYQFHQTARDGMVIDILAPATSQLLGRLYLHPAKGGDLVGQIALPTKRYAIRWHKNVAP